jgi:uncharacterized protein (DUF58 family)
VKFDRLNHAIFPETHTERERMRGRRWFRLVLPLVFVYTRLTAPGRVLLVLTFMVGAFGLQVEATRVYVLFSLLAGLCVAMLVPIGLFTIGNVAVHVRCSRRVSVGEAQRFDVELVNTGRQAQHGLAVAGPFLPSDGRWQGEPPAVDELRPAASVSLTCTARFRRRGEHHLDPFQVAALLPLGLSHGRPLSGEPVRFLVVPAIAPVTRFALPLARRHQPGGVALASKTGESMDLLGIRPYRPGDPVRDLHARSWARLGMPIVREYQEEYFSRIGIVVDTDAIHAEPRRLEAVLSLAAGLVACLSRGEALIDLLVVGDELHALTLGRSLGFLDQALDLLACVQAGPGFSGARMTRLLAPHLERLSAVAFVGLSWDGERVLFAQALRDQGVACQSIVLLGPGKTAPVSGDCLTVPVETVERREPLWL